MDTEEVNAGRKETGLNDISRMFQVHDFLTIDRKHFQQINRFIACQSYLFLEHGRSERYFRKSNLFNVYACIIDNVFYIAFFCAILDRYTIYVVNGGSLFVRVFSFGRSCGGEFYIIFIDIISGDFRKCSDNITFLD